MIITWEKAFFKTFFRKGTDEEGNSYYHVKEKDIYICITKETHSVGYGPTTNAACIWAKTREEKEKKSEKRRTEIIRRLGGNR